MIRILKPALPILFIVSPHTTPVTPPLQGIITNNWELLLKSKTTRILENAKIVFGFRRNKNLSDFLVRASTRSEPEPLRNIDKSPCNRRNSCRYCPKLNASGTLISKSSGRSYGCLTNVNCQSSNLIYVITCKPILILTWETTLQSPATSINALSPNQLNSMAYKYL